MGFCGLTKVPCRKVQPKPRPGLSGRAALVLNLNYKEAVDAAITAPAALERFDATKRECAPANAAAANTRLEAGGCKLVRVK